MLTHMEKFHHVISKLIMICMHVSIHFKTLHVIFSYNCQSCCRSLQEIGYFLLCERYVSECNLTMKTLTVLHIIYIGTIGIINTSSHFKNITDAQQLRMQLVQCRQDQLLMTFLFSYDFICKFLCRNFKDDQLCSRCD